MMQTKLNKEVREATIHWLESQQMNGAFDDFAEEDMNFNDCTDDEIKWYFMEWFYVDLEEQFGDTLATDYKMAVAERERILKEKKAEEQRCGIEYTHFNIEAFNEAYGVHIDNDMDLNETTDEIEDKGGYSVYYASYHDFDVIYNTKDIKDAMNFDYIAIEGDDVYIYLALLN